MKSKTIATLILAVSITNANGQLVQKKTFDSNHKLLYIEYMDGGKLTREISYYENGKKKHEANFQSNGKLYGRQIEYYDNGGKKSEIFIMGVDVVPYKFFTDSINTIDLVDVESFKSTSYYLNGQKQSEGYVIHGMRIGYWLFYNEKGEVEKSEFYKCLTKY